MRNVSVKGGQAEQAFCAKVLLERAGELEPRFAEYAMALRNHYGTYGQVCLFLSGTRLHPYRFGRTSVEA